MARVGSSGGRLRPELPQPNQGYGFFLASLSSLDLGFA
jgi:hypothetical protein